MLTSEELAKIKRKSQERRAALGSGYSNPKYFVRKGDEFTVRIVSDKNLEVARTVNEHKNMLNKDLKDLAPFRCQGDQCELCANIEEHDSLRTEYQYFQWTPSRRTLCYAYVLSYDGDNRYVKSQVHALLIGPWSLEPTILAIVGDCKTDDELSELLDPEVSGPVFRLQVKDKGQVVLEPLGKHVTIPPLPTSWPALADAYIPEGQVPDPEVLKKYRLAFNAWVERAIKIKPFPEKQQAAVTPPTEQSLEVEPVAENSSPIVTPVADHDCSAVPKSCPTSFGNRLQKWNPACMVCAQDEACARATEEATKSI